MDITKITTPLIVLQTILWVIVCPLAWNNYYLEALYLGVIIIGIYFILGTAKKGVVSKKLLFYPFGCWAVIWLVSFYYADYYKVMFQGVVPSFNILGFHPSMAFVVLGFWFGGFLTLTVGYHLLKDEWLTEQDWEDFKTKLKNIGLEATDETKIKRRSEVDV